MKGKVILGIVISLLFIYLSFFKPQFALLLSGQITGAFFGSPRIDIKELSEAMKSARLSFFFLIMGMLYLGWWIRAWRWRVLAMPVRKISSRLSFSAMMIGYLGNTILPLRAGEFMRAYVAAKRGNMAMSSSLAVVVVERILDMVMLLVVFGISLMVYPMPGVMKKAGIVTLVFTFAIIAFICLLLFAQDLALKIAGYCLKIVPQKISEKIMNIIRDFASGLDIFKKSEHYFMSIFWTLIMWGLYWAIIYVSFYCFDLISPNYPEIYKSPFSAALVILTITTAGIAIPSAPGAVGTYHGIALFGMSLFGVPSEIGLSYAILMHLANFAPMLTVGMYCMLREGFKLADLSSVARKKDSAEE